MTTVYNTNHSSDFKYCSICNLKKPFDAFGKNGNNALRSACRVCLNQRDRDKRAGKLVLTPLPVTSKICRSCRIEKPLEDFYPAAQGKHGRSSVCKFCKNESSKAYHQRSYPQKAERLRSYSREYRFRHPDRPKGKHVNNERDRQRAQRNYESNREERKAKVRAWGRANPLKRREYYRRYHVRKQVATVGRVSYTRILERDANYCYICEKNILSHHVIHFDHVIPLNRQGIHSEDNIRVTHAVCNLRKNERLLEEMTTHMRRGIE